VLPLKNIYNVKKNKTERSWENEKFLVLIQKDHDFERKEVTTKLKFGQVPQYEIFFHLLSINGQPQIPPILQEKSET
jgi:hypothetical protein